MKVLRRILTKVLILAAVIAMAGGGRIAWGAYQQSTPEYQVKQYLTCLIENDVGQAYALLDQSENTVMTAEEYQGALEAQKYSLYSGFEVKAGETRRDDSGNEYVECHVKFLNAADEVKQEDDLTLKKQTEPVFGIFDSWKVMADHCMVKDYQITVPAGSEVYLDNVAIETAWLVKKETELSYDSYVIPTVVPGDISVTIRHPIFEAVTAVLDVTDTESDYSGKMNLKKSAQNECEELGVRALKALFSAAVSDNLKESEALFADCMETAEQFVSDQASAFADSDAVFRHVAISDFAVQFDEPVFTNDENGAITAAMELSYHYVVREDVTYETGEYPEDGTAGSVTETQEKSGDATAEFEMAFYEEEWHIAAMELPVIPE